MDTFFKKYLPKIVFFGILGLLLLHIFKLDSFITIDNTSILLVVLLLLAPFASSLRKIKWGDLEAEIEPSEVKEVQEEIKQLPKPEKEESHYGEVNYVSNEINSILESDHILALAKLRMELERLLNRILILNKKEYPKRAGIDHIIMILEKENLISRFYINPIREVVRLCNRAIHGEEVRKKDAFTIVEMGLDLFEDLYSEYYSLAIKPVKERKITAKERDKYMDAKYEVTTVIPLVGKPKMNKYFFTQDQLDIFLECYEEYAEFLVGIKKIGKK